jgi:hypothetical protein
MLVAAVVLTLFGPAPGRRYARLIGLGVGGALLGVLLALVSLLGDQSRIFSRLYTLELNADQLKVAYGRGLWCALVAVLLTLAALWLAGRRADDEPAVLWSWRRPPGEEDEIVPEAPVDLAVWSDDQDRPAGQVQ